MRAHSRPVTPEHDLRREVEWLPVLYLDGRRDTLALQPLLEQAHLIREVELEPIEWAGVMRFLPSVTALIARADPRAEYDAWCTEGIPAAAIDAALGAVADRLWLRHPVTPFMQETQLTATATANDTEWLHLTVPAASSKAWWGKSGDGRHTAAGTPARVAQGLIASWYFSPGVSGKAVGFYADDPDTGWRPRGTLGRRNHGLRVFFAGDNLAHTLLANTMENHTRARGSNLPLWAVSGDIVPSAGPLTASTWTGSVYLLDWDGGRATGVRVGGRRIPGYSPEKDQRKKQVDALSADLWRADPTIPRAPVLRAGEETGEVVPIRALHPSANAVQWAAEWHASDARRGAARAMEPGLVDAAGTDVIAIRIDGAAASPELSHFARIGEVSAVAAPGARNRLMSLSALIVTPIRGTLNAGLAKALGHEAAKPLYERLYAAFCSDVEPVLDDLIHAPALTRDHATAFTRTAQSTFERFLAPYMNSRTLAGTGTGGGEGIAAALALVEGRVSATLREVKS